MSTMKDTTHRNSLHYPLSLDGKDMERELFKPFKHITAIPGKTSKLNIVKVLECWIEVTKDKVPIIDQLANYLYNGSFLIDDIQDSSELRRGVPTAHKVYGIGKTLQGVEWIRANIFDCLIQLNHQPLTQTCLKTSVGMFAGQGMELYWRDNYICPTEEEYLEMIYRKTGLFFLVIQNIMNHFSTGRKVEASRLLTNFGLYFQISDDYENLQNQDYHESKGFCEDITEGKFSFPIVHAINNFPEEGKIIKEILRERTVDVQRKKECLALLEKCGSFEYTKRKLKVLKAIVYEEVDKLNENPLIDEFVEKSMSYSV